MKKFTCPYLGMSDDPTTALNFPSEGNFCHHAKPIAPVDRNYQQQFCLTSEHTTCPIFLAAHPQPLPAEMSEAVSYPPNRRMLALLSIPVLIAGTAALALVWNNVANQAWGTNTIPITGGGAASWSLLQTDAKTAPSLTPDPVPSNELPVATCPMPIGWMPYTVHPTDSLYRLSVIYGVSVQQLQQVNCLKDQTVISPGQIIYVPRIPTDTPTSTSIPARVLPTNAPQAENDEPNPASTNTPIPNTPIPITPIPNTPVPNTPVPPASTNTPVPPPREKPTEVKKDKGKDKGTDKGKGKGKGNGKGNGKGKGKGKGK